MKTFILSLILFLLTPGMGFSSCLGTLPQVMKPVSAQVDEENLYIMDEGTVSVYSLKDLRLICKFGKEGEGPGELKNTPLYINRMMILQENVMLEGLDKIIFFSKQGQLQKEIKKKTLLTAQTIPIKSNFAAHRVRIIDRENGVHYNCITLYNPEMEEIKDLYCMKHFYEGQPPSLKVEMLMDAPHFRVYGDKIFIEKSAEGFIIDVFDHQGSKLYQINNPYEKIKFTDTHKNEIIERFKSDFLIKRSGGWEQFRKTCKMIFPDTFPAINDFEISSGRIYIRTYKTVEDKVEYMVTDLKGKLIKKVYIPRFQASSLLAEVMGVKLHSIQKDKLYYLHENEEKEYWELYVEDIK